MVLCPKKNIWEFFNKFKMGANIWQKKGLCTGILSLLIFSWKVIHGKLVISVLQGFSNQRISLLIKSTSLAVPCLCRLKLLHKISILSKQTLSPLESLCSTLQPSNFHGLEKQSPKYYPHIAQYSFHFISWYFCLNSYKKLFPICAFWILREGSIFKS